jgi:Holliday junction resolvase RusA-like endonuclease
VAELRFHIPWSALCSDNRKYLSGRFILSSAYRASKEEIGTRSTLAARKAKWKRVEGPVSLCVVVREPDRRRRDLNWSKNAKDGITAGEGVWWDDSQVRVETWAFTEPCDKDRAGAEVLIRTLDRLDQTLELLSHDSAPVGRSGQLQPAVAPRPQRARRVRRGSTATE